MMNPLFTELPRIRFYHLRHTHASLLIAEGVHAKKIAERLGHASIKLTMDTYGHLFEGSDQESAERMDRIFPAMEAEPLSGQVGRIHPVSPASVRPHADKNADETVLFEVCKALGG
jgi:hypothetical protein